MECSLPFGGKVVVFGGDFRQVLPVVTRGTRAQITDATLLRSYLWQKIRKIRASHAICRHRHTLGSRNTSYGSAMGRKKQLATTMCISLKTL
uniref:ATP-dependent DNA helicase n=1 Tax=Aegilops tauschii subsp. strangulata TaxID=200361 RepID=A0A453NCD3_AEGTS